LQNSNEVPAGAISRRTGCGAGSDQREARCPLPALRGYKATRWQNNTMLSRRAAVMDGRGCERSSVAGKSSRSGVGTECGRVRLTIRQRHEFNAPALHSSSPPTTHFPTSTDAELPILPLIRHYRYYLNSRQHPASRRKQGLCLCILLVHDLSISAVSLLMAPGSRHRR